jgi:hypothetical protein
MKALNTPINVAATFAGHVLAWNRFNSVHS